MIATWIWERVDALRQRGYQRLGPLALVSGKRGEDAAQRYLRRRGYTVVARNYRTRSGTAEADIVAWDGDQLVFVEVKSVHDALRRAPEERVNAQKRQHIVRAAREYTRRADVAPEKVRFDVIAVVLEKQPQITHYRAAF